MSESLKYAMLLVVKSMNLTVKMSEKTDKVVQRELLKYYALHLITNIILSVFKIIISHISLMSATTPL